MNEKRLFFIGLVVALVVACWLRLDGLDEYWFNPDEGLFINVANQPLVKPLLLAIANEANPPLYYYLVRLISIISLDAAWLRFPSVLAGLASVLLLGLGVRRVAGSVAGIAAAVLLAVSPAAVCLSQLVRPYMVLLMFETACLFLMFRYFRTGLRRDMWWYSGCLAAMILTHYSALLVAAGMGLGWLVQVRFSQQRPRPWADFIRAHLPGGIAAMLLILLHIGPFLMGSNLQQSVIRGYLSKYWIFSLSKAPGLLFSSDIWAVGFYPALILLPLTVFGFWRLFRDKKYAALTAISVVLVLAALLAYLKIYPLGHTRHVTFLMPFWIILSAVGVGEMFRHGWRVGAIMLGVVIVLGVGVFSMNLGAVHRGGLLQLKLERLLTMSDFEEFSRFFDVALAKEGDIFLDKQSCLTLIPKATADGRGIAVDKYGVPQNFIWGKRRVFVYPGWSWSRGGAKGKPLMNLREFVFQCRPGLNDKPDFNYDFWLIETGWGMNLSESFRFSSSPVQLELTIPEKHRWDGLHMFRLKFAEYSELTSERSAGSGNKDGVGTGVGGAVR